MRDKARTRFLSASRVSGGLCTSLSSLPLHRRARCCRWRRCGRMRISCCIRRNASALALVADNRDDGNGDSGNDQGDCRAGELHDLIHE